MLRLDGGCIHDLDGISRGFWWNEMWTYAVEIRFINQIKSSNQNIPLFETRVRHFSSSLRMPIISFTRFLYNVNIHTYIYIYRDLWISFLGLQIFQPWQNCSLGGWSVTTASHYIANVRCFANKSWVANSDIFSSKSSQWFHLLPVRSIFTQSSGSNAHGQGGFQQLVHDILPGPSNG